MRPDSSAYLSSRDTSRRTGEAAAMNIAPQNRVLGTRDRPVGHATHATGIVSPARSGCYGRAVYAAGTVTAISAGRAFPSCNRFLPHCPHYGHGLQFADVGQEGAQRQGSRQIMNDAARDISAAQSIAGWGSDVMADMLRALEIPYVALNPGASFRGLHDSLVNHLGNTRPELLLCVHEEHAVALAHGYARVTGRPLAVALHANVGLMHATMAIFNAWCDRIPIFMLGGVGPVDAAKRRPWVDWIHTSRDLGALVRGYTKWDDQPGSVAAALEAIVRAYRIALTPPQAPVYVCLDAALQEEALSAPVPLPALERFPAPTTGGVPQQTVREVARLLA